MPDNRPRFEDVIPCRHGVSPADVDRVKVLLTDLHVDAPALLAERGISVDGYPMLLRAAIESLRGTSSATTTEKRRFLEAILDHGVAASVFSAWEFVGTAGRQDYRVRLPNETVVGIEAKGCPDGNNTTIWDRPGWANEFVVWSMCPESLVHHPGHGVWSGVSTRLMPKLAAERERGRVDAFIFWDGRCGSSLRQCPKEFGITGGLRATATDVPGQDGRQWLPPPCIYLFPDAPPNVRNNKRPRVHTVADSHFARALLNLFEVPTDQQARYVHSAAVEARGTETGTQIRVSVVSRCWPDGADRSIVARWKSLKRE